MTIERYLKAHSLYSKINQLEMLYEEVSNGYRFDLIKSEFLEIINKRLRELNKMFEEL